MAHETRALLHDHWFWLSVALGPFGSWLLLELVSGDAAAGIALSQWRELLWLTVLYPVAEEWLFRGLLQGTLLQIPVAARAVLGFTAANLVTSLCFSAAHLFTHTLFLALLVIIPSLVFGWFRDRYQSILPGVFLHCFYNLCYFIFFGLPPA